MARYHVGIDVGKKSHHACVRDSEEDTYGKVFSFTADRDGFQGFLEFLDSHAPKDQFLIGMEAAGPYSLTLRYFLLERGYTVVEVNPFHANQFRKAQGKKAKTDRIDARSLAAFLSVGSCKPLTLTDPVLENLRELTRFRADLIQDRTRQLNRLHEVLATSFPELMSQLTSVDSPTILTLLESYPGPQALLEADPQAITAHLHQHSRGQMGGPKAQAILRAASTSVGLLRRQKALTLKLQLLAQSILSLNAQIHRLEAEIEELFRQLPYDPSHFPVGGVQALASILAEIEDIHRFSTLKQFLSSFGWCPKTFQTGEYRQEHPKMSHAGNSYLRRMIWMLSILAVRTVPAYQDYFQRRTASGKKKMHTLVAVGRKLLSTFYAILKTGRPYDPQQLTPLHLPLVKA